MVILHIYSTCWCMKSVFYEHQHQAIRVHRRAAAIEEPPSCHHRPPPHGCRTISVCLRLIRVARCPLLDLLVLALLTPPPERLQRDLFAHATTPVEAMVTAWLRVSCAPPIGPARPYWPLRQAEPMRPWAE
jgi:hypothetical protein